MTADSSSIVHSPRSPPPPPSGDGVGGGLNSARSLSSPWVQVVRGGESESVLSPPPSSSPLRSTAASESNDRPATVAVKGSEEARGNSDCDNCNAGPSRKPAWNKPLNGVVEASTSVMGAVSWPALSESIGTTAKSSSDSSKPLSDGSLSLSQASVISHPSQKQHNANAAAKPNFTPTHTMPAKPRNNKRGGSVSTQSGFIQPPDPPSSAMPLPFPVSELPYGSMVPPVLDAAGRESHYKHSNWEIRPQVGGAASQSHGVNGHSSQRNSSRKGKFGLRPVGEGLYHNAYAGRRGQDRDARGSNIRDVHLPHQVGPPPPRGLIRQRPPGSAPYIAPQPVRPFGNPMGFDMASQFVYVPQLPPDSLRGMPLLAHVPPQPMLYPLMDPSLPSLLINQIEYYFSDANLVKDDFLRSNMDDQGWVLITLIAGFPRVQHLTNNIPLILESLRGSAVVEVQGDKVRRRNEWSKWIPRFPTATGSQSPGGSSGNKLVTSIQKVSLGDVTLNHNNIRQTDNFMSEAQCRHSSEDLVERSTLANGQGVAEEACSTEK